MILLDTDLKKYTIKIEEIENQAKLYDFINNQRISYSNQVHMEKITLAEKAKKKHINSIEFHENLKQNELEKVKNYLLENN